MLMAERIDEAEALERVSAPVRRFMLEQVRGRREEYDRYYNTFANPLK